MLIIEATIAKPCAKGQNLAEQALGPRKKVMTSTGEAWMAETVAVYTAGLPLPDGMSKPVAAPIDLLPGDLVLVEAGDYVPYKVIRGEKELWTNKTIADAETADAKARQAKRDFYAATQGR